MLKWLAQWRAWNRIDDGSVNSGNDDALRLHHALQAGAASEPQVHDGSDASGRVRARVEASIRAGAARGRIASTQGDRGWMTARAWATVAAAVVIVLGLWGVVWLGGGPGRVPTAPESLTQRPEADPSTGARQSLLDRLQRSEAVAGVARLEQPLERESRLLAADVTRAARTIRSKLPLGLGQPRVLNR